MAMQAVSPTTTQDASNQVFAAKTVTQDEFLKLLLVQLQNQDPLQPMDNQEFAAQLATFNSLGQLIDINQKLGGLQSAQGLASYFSAASLLGKDITSSGNGIRLEAGTPVSINYRLEGNAARVVVNIRSASGELVRQLDANGGTAGDHAIVWDGKDGSGRALPGGLYRFEISAVDTNDRAVPASGRVRGTVTGVRLDGAEPLLQIGELEVPLSSLTAVRPPS